MKNNQNQIRAELLNRRSKESSLKSSSDEAKRSRKIIKKNLNSAFTFVDKDAPVDSASSTSDGTPTLEMSEDNREKESTENILVGKLNSPLCSASSKTSMTTDLTPSSVITTNDSDLFVLNGDEISKAPRSEAEVVSEYLKQARLQILSSTGVDLRFKKLLDALIEVTVKEFNTLPDDRDWMDELISAKNHILFVCSFTLLIAVSMILLLRSGTGDSAYYQPPPPS